MSVPEYLSSLAGASEPIPCPLCGSQEHVPIYEGLALRGNELVCVCCKRCTHLFLNPRPPLLSFKDFYRGDNYFHLCAEFSRVSLEDKLAQFSEDTFWEQRFAHGKRLHERHLSDVLGPGDIAFDFGCGDGAWLGGLREASGCEIDGEEISDVYAEVIKERLDVEVILGPIEEVGDEILARYDERKVKVAIVSGSLQHMLEPLRCLDIARRILADDGLLFVCNWSLFDHYMAPCQGPDGHLYDDCRRLLGENLSWEHAHYFHETSFRFMIEAAQFEIVEFEPHSAVRPRHMGALARKASPDSPAPQVRETLDQVLARLRALEAANLAARVSPRIEAPAATQVAVAAGSGEDDDELS
jgi:SAM-dependent methyltransferase